MAASDEGEPSKGERRRFVAQGEGFCPSGRPLNYRGGRNWETRIATRTVTAAAIGSLVGLGVGLFKKQNPFVWLRSMGADYGIATCVFCGFQELAREIRAAEPDNWADCLLGGLASGALLGRIHGGPARAVPSAVLFASVGTGINLGANIYKEFRLRHLLGTSQASENQLSPVDSAERESKQSDLTGRESKLATWFDFEFPEWFPIQKLNEEEARRRHLEREKKLHNRLDALQAGTLPHKDQ